MAMKHQSATAENRRAARSAWSPPRSACASSTSSPPAHNDPARRWISMLLVARSCEPPAEECPVRPSGTRVSSAPANSNGVHDHRSTIRAPTVTTRAIRAVQRQAEAVSTRPAARQISNGFRWSRSGFPETSETVNATSNAAQTVQTPDATPANRSARYPETSRTPFSCGGLKNAANMNPPTAVTAAISPTARTNGRPNVVTGPGSGRPVAVSASASARAPIPAAIAPASTATAVSIGHTARVTGVAVDVTGQA